MSLFKVADLFAHRLSLERALAPDEVDALEELLKHDPLCRGVRRGWTRTDDDRLRALRSRGTLAPEIARELGRTPWAIRARIKRLKGDITDAV